jgi:hypothetical protein
VSRSLHTPSSSSGNGFRSCFRKGRRAIRSVATAASSRQRDFEKLVQVLFCGCCGAHRAAARHTVRRRPFQGGAGEHRNGRAQDRRGRHAAGPTSGDVVRYPGNFRIPSDDTTTMGRALYEQGWNIPTR